MVAFLPILYYAAAGLAALTLSGCAGSHPLPPPKTPTPKKPEPPKAPEAPKGPDYPKYTLQFGDEEDPRDGYELMYHYLSDQVDAYRGMPITPEHFFLGPPNDTSEFNTFINFLLQDPSRVTLAKKFIERTASHDGNPQDISSYDFLFSSFYLFSKQWGESWEEKFLATNEIFPYSLAENIKLIGRPLLDLTAGKTLASQSRDQLQSLALYLKSKDADPHAVFLPLVEFFLNGTEPQVFADYLGLSYKEFLNSSEVGKAEIFQGAVESRWPTPEDIEKLSPYLQGQDLYLWTKTCFKKDPIASLRLFEQVSLPEYFSLLNGNGGYSNEVKMFPNLAQDLPFPERQKAIDGYLAEPTLIIEKKHPAVGIKTTVKKYQWVGETEVFSIESGKPGPTTLVFSPHFHEANPRKYFHWLKDMPLQSGRIIFIPEANRAMYRARKNTNPMNGLFNEALQSQRIDYVIVRRVEYLMGLVDGVIGDHDSGHGPFYISDILVNQQGEGSAELGPKPSPWVPKEVKQIKQINYGIEPPKDKTPGGKIVPPVVEYNNSSQIREDNQVQWQIADYSRKKLRKLTGLDFHFEPEKIRNENSESADSTTGYAQFRLGKPAMTFEGNKGKEHGQLHAMAIYTLLLAFGHKISTQFEKKLKDPLPRMEPELYRGNHVTLTNLPEEDPSAKGKKSGDKINEGL